MALLHSLRKGLQLVKSNKSPEKAEECFNLLKDALLNRNDVNRPGIDVIIICAEAALQAERIDLARASLELYDAEAAILLHGGENDEELEILDQFRVRAKYARGVVEAYEARSCKGNELVERTLDAIAIITEGMELAKANPRHTFLIYNGSVHFWHASWVLQRAGMRKHVVEPTQRVVQFLQSVQGQNTWRARLQIALARGLAEVGRTDEATKTLAEAKALAVAAGDIDIQKEVVTVSTHLTYLAGKGKTEGSTPSEQALSIAQEARTVASLSKMQVEEKLHNAYDLVDPDPDAPPSAVDLSVVATIAWACACRGVLDLGEDAAKRALSSKDLRVRARAELSVCQLELQKVQADFGDDSLIASNIHKRENILAGAEQCCTQFLRLLDPSGVQDAAILIWNAALPLLQKNLRSRLKRVFLSAANALAAIQSPMTRLRAQLHLEIAKLDAEEDSMVKAAEQVAAGLMLDYKAAEEEQERTDLERPLDRYLVPMFKALQLKTQLYEEPESIEDQVIVLVERAKDLKGSSAKHETLERAITLFMDLPALSPPYEPAGGAQEGEEGSQASKEELKSQRRHARDRNAVWMEIIRVGWASRLCDIVLQAAPFALAPKYDPKVDHEMVRMQAEICFIEAEAGILALKNRGKTLMAPGLVGYPDEYAKGKPGVDENGLPYRMPPSTPEEIQQRIPAAIVQGMRHGLSVGQKWLVVNGAVYSWNHYTHVFLAKDLKDMLPFIGDVFDILMELDDIDPELLCNLGNMLASSLEHEALVNHFANDDVPYKSLLFQAAREKIRLPDDEDIQRALRVCDLVVSKLKDADPLRAFVETHARIQALSTPAAPPAGKDGKGAPQGGLKELDMDDASLKELAALVVAGINMVGEPGASDAEKAHAIGTAAMALSKTEERTRSGTDVEMWTKLGQAALLAGMPSESVQCCKHTMSILPANVKVDEIDMKEDVSSATIPMDDRVLYWLSMCQNIMSQATLGLIEPSQDAIMQARLKRMAIRHAVASAKFGSFCKRKDLINAAARLLWNASVDFINMVVTRKTLVAPFGDVATILADMGIEDPEFGVRFFTSLADLMVEDSRYADGLLYMDEALRCLPQSMHMPLLEYKVLFASKLGRDVEAEMLRVANFTPAAQAKVWLVLATESISTDAQLEGRQKAIDVLKNEPWSQAEYLVELAEYLLYNERNQQMARDTLLEAASLYIRSDHTKLLGEVHTMDLFSTVRTAALKVEHLEGFMRCMTLLASIRRTYGQRVACAMAAAHVAKIIVKMIGDQVNATHWGIPTLEEQDAEEERRAIAEGRPSLMKSNTFRRQREEVIPAIGPNGEAPLVPWFDNPLEWWKWKVPDEAIPMLKDETRSKYPRMHAVALKQPEQMVHFLKYLIDMLDGLGLPAAAIPCTGLLFMAAQQGLRGQLAASAAYLYQSKLFDRMGLGKQAEACLDKAGDLSKQDAEQQESENDMAQMEMSDALARAQKSSKLAGDLGFGRISPTLEKQKAHTDKQKMLARSLSRQDSQTFLGKSIATIDMRELRRKLQEAAATVHEMRPMTIHDIWMLRVWYLVERYQYGPAREILMEAHKHAEALGDSHALGMVCVWQTKMEVLANNRELAIQYARMAMEHGGDLRMWRTLLVAAAEALTLRSREQRSGDEQGQECIEFIEKCISIFSQIRHSRGELEWEVGSILADLVRAKAKVMAERIREGREALKPTDCSMHFNAGMQALQTAVHIFRPMGLSPMLAQCLKDFAEFVVSGARVPGRKMNEDGRPRLRQAQASLKEAEQYASLLREWIDHVVPLKQFLEDNDTSEDESGDGEKGEEVAKVDKDKKKSKEDLEAEEKARQEKEAREAEMEEYRLAAYPVERLLAECRALLAMTEYEIGNLSKLYAEKDKRRARPRFPKNPNVEEETEAADAVADWLDKTAGHDWDAGLKNFQSAVQWADDSFAVTVRNVPGGVAQAKYAKGAALLALHSREQEQIKSLQQERPSGAVAGQGGKDGEEELAEGEGAEAAKVEEGVAAEGQEGGEGEGEEEKEPSLEEKGLQLLLEALEIAHEAQESWTAMRVCEALAGHRFASGDNKGAVEAVLLAQSCKAVDELLRVYTDAAALQALERLKSRQRTALKASVTSLSESRHYNAVDADLRTVSLMSDFLRPKVPTEEALAMIPEDTDVICLYLSQDDSTLYIASRVLMPPQGEDPPPTAQKEPHKPDKDHKDAKEDEGPRVEWSVRMLQVHVPELKDAVLAYMAFRKAVENVFVSARNAKRGGGETTDPVTQALDSKWAEVRPLMEAQLDPIFAAMSDALPPLDGRKVLLLPDAVLGRLPLESLPVFKGAASMGRDFSLALMYNRLSHVKEKPREEQGAGEGKGAAPGKGAGDAKGGKGGGKGGAVEEEGASFQVGTMSYLVDLRAEDDPASLPGRKTGKLAEEFGKGILKSIGSGWRGVLGAGDKVAGEDECIALFESSSALIYMGMGRFGAFVSPRAVAAADLRGCRLAMILDGVVNEELDRRQSSVDLRKAAWELASEGAYEMACVLSLRGVTTVVVNLAAAHPDANMHVAKCLELLKQGKAPDVGTALTQSLRSLPAEAEYLAANTVLFGCPFLAPK